ncbi:hypothetical protein BDV98DRAFT_598527, partial [Pterulicium gracile]
MTLDEHMQVVNFLITNIGADDIILGLPWLCKANPTIRWKDGTLDLEGPPEKKKLNVVIKEKKDVERPKVLGWTPTGDLVLEEEPNGTINGESEPEAEEEESTRRRQKGRSCQSTCLSIGLRGTKRQGVLGSKLGTFTKELGDKLWVCAGYTFSQQIAERASKGKAPCTRSRFAASLEDPCYQQAARRIGSTSVSLNPTPVQSWPRTSVPDFFETLLASRPQTPVPTPSGPVEPPAPAVTIALQPTVVTPPPIAPVPQPQPVFTPAPTMSNLVLTGDPAVDNVLNGLITAMQKGATGGGLSGSLFARPDPFKGEGYADARCFLLQFEIWSKEKDNLKNNEQKKICSALGLCSGTAG